jgi:indoleamine 2,3-dioxygenase
MEARGGSIISKLMRAVDAVAADDPAVITEVLLDVANTLQLLADLLDRMHEHCDPYVFYYQLRPFLAGSKNMTAAGLPRGVFYDEGEGEGRWRMYSGGSNAQSSLIQFFDVILGIQHKSTGESVSKSGAKSNAFIQVCMSRLMRPGFS